MPIYEYKCTACGIDFEELMPSAHAGSKVSCGRCGSADVKRTMSMFGFASKNSSGEMAPSGRSGHNCSGCASHNCGHCH